VTRSITVEGAAKRFPNGVEVFDGLDLAVTAGECLCVVGPSGCGKTTLVRAIDGLVPLDRGRITIGGVEVEKPRRDVAMVFQHFGLFPWKTVAQNIGFGLEMAGLDRPAMRERVARQVDMMGLGGFENALPHQLSGGMQQRVGLGRAMILEPDVLLMDEPFGSLDALTRELLQDQLLRIWETRPRTMVFITHSIEEAIALGDRVVVLGPRPARVRTVITVDIPRPRTVAGVIADPSFVELRDHCWALLRDAEAA
jgi:NitT/TauT family transport system ATP-binding protein